MAFSIDDKVKVLKKPPPAACAVITEYSPGFETDPQMKLVGGLTFRKLAPFPPGRPERGPARRDRREAYSCE